uniref:PQ-loop repeat-containing protein n=1 Tax=viral metagenome TaxID=1070528 RepID=A0A6C0K0Z9_9ZZZZ
MEHDYLMNIATILFFACYIPELYANYKNKNANMYNLPEKVVVLTGSAFAFAYAYATDNQVLIINYAPLLTLDILAFLMRAYYVYKNRATPAIDGPVVEAGP